MPNKPPDIKRGTSLVEVLIYTAIVSVVLVMVSNLLWTLLSFIQESRGRKALISNSRFISDRLKRDLTGATAVSEPGSIDFETRLTITLPDEGQVQYRLENGRLYRNNALLSDEQVTVSAGAAEGWRLVGETVDWRIGVTASQQPLSGRPPGEIIKGTVYLINLP